MPVRDQFLAGRGKWLLHNTLTHHWNLAHGKNQGVQKAKSRALVGSRVDTNCSGLHAESKITPEVTPAALQKSLRVNFFRISDLLSIYETGRQTACRA